MKAFNACLWIRRGVALAGLALLGFGALGTHTRKAFDNPVAYAFVGERLYVIERKGNTLLELAPDLKRHRMRLLSERAIEPDDDRYYYMARHLYPGPEGRLVVQSFIYTQDTHEFQGYRFRLYDGPEGRPIRDVFTIFFTHPETYPEIAYAYDAEGRHYLLNNCEGLWSIWRLPADASSIMRGTNLPDGIRRLGEINSPMSSWMGLCVGDDRTLYASSGADDRIVRYAPDGARLTAWGTPGFGEGDLLAPKAMCFIAAPGCTQRLFTVSSTGNRTWVQFDATGRPVRMISPLDRGYPFADILIGNLHAAANGTWLSFDRVNHALVVIDREAQALDRYEAPFPTRRNLCLAVGAVLTVLALIGPRLPCPRRLRFPLFVKLLVLVIPLLLGSTMLVQKLIMEEVKKDEDAVRQTNLRPLAADMAGRLHPEDLEALNLPEDRNSAAYSNVWDALDEAYRHRHVEPQLKWILHKIHHGQYFFGVNIWRGPLFEPFIVRNTNTPVCRARALKEPQYGLLADDQGEWVSFVYPITNRQGEVHYALELYRPSEDIDRFDDELARKVNPVRLWTAAAAALVLLPFSFFFLRPLRQLMHGIQRVGEGHFEENIVVHSRDELRDVADAFNGMLADLRRYTADLERTTAERERLDAELRIAREVQQGILPTRFPPHPGVETAAIGARIEPAKEIGGDFYDFFPVDREHLGVLMADVAGKGMPAGLFMMMVNAQLRDQASGELSAARTLEAVNRAVESDNPSAMFVTLFYTILDLRDGTLIYCNGGHNPPLLIRSGRPQWLRPSGSGGRGMVIGVEADARFTDGHERLAPGDTLLLYTDGVTEAIDGDGEQYGNNRLLHAARNHADASPQALCNAIYEDVMRFQTGREPFDDITLLALRYLGA